MTDDVRAGLQRVYRGTCEGVAMMPGTFEAMAFDPLLRDLERVLGDDAKTTTTEA